MNTNVLDFGAVNDGSQLCTAAIQAAIDACHTSGGGRVSVPNGTYYTGTIWLKSNVELHLEHGAVIKASENMDDYNAEDAYPQNFSVREAERWLGKHLVIAHECEHVAITGTGTFDGNGASFMGAPEPHCAYLFAEGFADAKDPEKCRPGQMICFIECQHVVVQDVTLTNQPCWGCFLHGCEHVSIRGIKIFNDHTFACADGIDIDCCRYVTVSDCIIDTGDDGITLRAVKGRLKNQSGLCEYITITNCIVSGSSSAFRIGVGGGTIRHARYSNICIPRASKGIQIMTSYQGKGNVSIDDISFSNLSITNCARPFEISEKSQDCATVSNVVVENVDAQMYGYFHLNCTNKNTVKNITLRNWHVAMVDGPKPMFPKCYKMRGTVWFRASNIESLRFEKFTITDEEGYIKTWEDGAFAIKDCTQLYAQDLTLNGKEIRLV